jgi:hypothetical protein
MKKTLLVLVLVLVSSTVYARPRRRSNYTTNYRSYTTNYTSGSVGTDQERCQAEADYMAANRISGHVWGVIGRFEGVGCGFSPNCRTCTPGNSSMICTGDASARGSNGMWYRVRSWR